MKEPNPSIDIAENFMECACMERDIPEDAELRRVRRSERDRHTRQVETAKQAD